MKELWTKYQQTLDKLGAGTFGDVYAVRAARGAAFERASDTSKDLHDHTSGRFS